MFHLPFHRAARWLPALACSMLTLSTSTLHAQDLPPARGAGATFPSAVYQSWIHKYAQASGRKVSYEPTGSGDGQRKMLARSVDFAGTDVPLSPDDLKKHQLLQLPMLISGIVPVVQFKTPTPLRLSGAVLADIYSGQITRWNDPRIAELNAGTPLPALAIVRVVRKEGSGSTDAFTRYLATVSPGFAKVVTPGLQPRWPGEVMTAEGNDGVVRAVQNTPGAIAYVSYDRLLKAKLQGVKLQNAAGRFVSPSELGFKDAVRHSDLAAKGEETASLLNRQGDEAWPITVASYILVDARPKAADTARAPLQFLNWTLQSGDRLLADTGFAPLPVTVQARLAARLASVKTQDGQTIAVF